MEIINFILNSFESIYNFVKAIFGLIPTILSFLPNPFRLVSLTFLAVYLIIYLWKLYKGGS